MRMAGRSTSDRNIGSGSTNSPSWTGFARPSMRTATVAMRRVDFDREARELLRLDVRDHGPVEHLHADDPDVGGWVGLPSRVM
jgi:hypothetical protein